MNFLEERVHYTIVGKGPEKKQIEEMVKNYHLAENIKLVGEVPRETVMEYLKMADMYLFPSLREGGSWALMEAMAAELPVVCFDWTGTGVITDDLCANRIKPTSMKQDGSDGDCGYVCACLLWKRI